MMREGMSTNLLAWEGLAVFLEVFTDADQGTAFELVHSHAAKTATKLYPERQRRSTLP